MGRDGRACGGDGVGARDGGAREGSPWMRWGPSPFTPMENAGEGKFFFTDPRSGESWAQFFWGEGVGEKSWARLWVGDNPRGRVWPVARLEESPAGTGEERGPFPPAPSAPPFPPFLSGRRGRAGPHTAFALVPAGRVAGTGRSAPR